MLRRAALLFVLVLLLLILSDVNEETVFIVGAFLTWFFLYEVVGAAVKDILYKDLQEQYVLLTRSILEVKRTYLEGKSTMTVAQNWSNVLRGLFVNFLQISLKENVITLIIFTENLLNARLTDVVERYGISQAKKTLELGFLTEALLGRSSLAKDLNGVALLYVI